MKVARFMAAYTICFCLHTVKEQKLKPGLTNNSDILLILKGKCVDDIIKSMANTAKGITTITLGIPV